LAVPGGPSSRLCCPASTAVTSDRTTLPRSQNRSASSSVIARSAAAVPAPVLALVSAVAVMLISSNKVVNHFIV
jgi:hypothetical protein